MTKAIVRECTFTLTIKSEYLKKHSIEEYASWARNEIWDLFMVGTSANMVSPNSFTIGAALSRRDFCIAIDLLNSQFQHALEGLEAHQEKKAS